jgi:SAM-dependent methyltransferase
MRSTAGYEERGEMSGNRDQRTIDSFGDEWERFDQSAMADEESKGIFDSYFAIFPWDALPADATGFDMGCGTGRWAKHVAPQVGQLHCIDPSSALEVAKRNLEPFQNVRFHAAGVADSSLPDGSQDFGYSLGVLHHVPDTAGAVAMCARMLKPGAPMLLYLYYDFDNRPAWFRLVWRCSELGRALISRMPGWAKHFVTDLIAAFVYFPLARMSLLLERLGAKVGNIPLSSYRQLSFYTMRTDSRDRFGTPLEQRFTRAQIEKMMVEGGLRDVRFSSAEPYWCAVGIKA